MVKVLLEAGADPNLTGMVSQIEAGADPNFTGMVIQKVSGGGEGAAGGWS